MFAQIGATSLNINPGFYTSYGSLRAAPFFTHWSKALSVIWRTLSFSLNFLGSDNGDYPRHLTLLKLPNNHRTGIQVKGDEFQTFLQMLSTFCDRKSAQRQISIWEKLLWVTLYLHLCRLKRTTNRKLHCKDKASLIMVVKTIYPDLKLELCWCKHQSMHQSITINY